MLTTGPEYTYGVGQFADCLTPTMCQHIVQALQGNTTGPMAAGPKVDSILE